MKPARIVIEYCSGCGYERRARALAAHLQAAFGEAQIELVTRSGGAFEVRADDAPIFSKLELGRFPSEEEIVEEIEDS